MEVIVFNDLHLADNPPGRRKPGYKEEGLAMLEEIGHIYAEQDSWSEVFTTGDLFHLKDAKKNSLSLLGDVIDLLKTWQRPLWVVPGNHDMNPKEGLDGQPLGLLVKAGVARILGPQGSWFYCPQPEVLITPRPYSIERDTDPAYYGMVNGDKFHCVIMLAHGSIVPDHEPRPYPHLTLTQLDADPAIDFLVCGHIHEDLGVWSMRPHDGKGLFVNVGSLGRTAFTESNCTRHPKIVKINPLTKVLEVVPLKSALPGEDIFTEEVEVAKGAEKNEIAQFVAGLTKGMELETVDVLQLVKSMDMNPEVAEKVIRYLEEAGA